MPTLNDQIACALVLRGNQAQITTGNVVLFFDASEVIYYVMADVL
jgi:hypothetical protein